MSSLAASSSSAPLLTSALSNVALVGSSWMCSSIMFSTYFTTKFLKYDSAVETKKKTDFETRQLQVLSGTSSPPSVKSTENTGRFSITKFKSANTMITPILQSMSRAQLLTLFRFSGSLLMGIFLNPQVMECGKRLMFTLQYMQDFALPAAFLFVANYCNSIALDRIGISLTYTSKCIIPLITVLMTLLMDGVGALPSSLALAMLIPIAGGVAMASWNSPTFEKKGFLAAMTSSTAQAALNVSSKRALIKTGISGLEAQRSMVAVAFSIAICMSLQSCFQSNRPRSDEDKGVEKGPELPPFWLALAASAAYHSEYVLSFMFINMVQPISYGTCDAIRRLGIIVAGRFFFGGDPFSKLNYGGIGFALLGAMGYSIASAK